MCNWRHAIIVVAAISSAASAHAQSELSESVESFEATGDSPAFESFEEATDESIEDDFRSAEWSDADLPNLVDENSDDDASAPTSFWFGGAELLRLKPRYTLGSTYRNYNDYYAPYGDTGVYKDDPDDAPRAFLGWESANGLGIRGRFWKFENGGLIDPEYEWSRTWRMDATRFDADVYRRFQFNRGSIAAGANLATVDLSTDGFFPKNSNYEAVGLGVFAEGRHTLYESDRVACALIGRGRWSQLMGKHSYDVTSSIPSIYVVNSEFLELVSDVHYIDVTQRHRDDADLQIAEVAAGLELVRKFRHADLVFQYAVEVQNWNLNPNDELSFLGSTFAISLRR
jgi:hypothetical protein